ncbi:hypothetical protein Tco_0938444 [Tanacetum coccineum]|uniref:Uncharacterized protein n=1 Tax=Tanacetum coccineum TaxID=301880 RepID=A0ABQ5DNC1_9ASTR
MALSIADQIALDDALVALADRLKIGKCNLRLSSVYQIQGSTLKWSMMCLKHTPNNSPKTKSKQEEEQIQMQSPKLKPPTAPRKRSPRKRKQKNYRASHASGSGADEGTGVKPGVPDAPDYDSEDDISWKSTDG